MKIAVTGASGFIGRHVLKELPGSVVKMGRLEIDLLNPPSDAFEKLGCPDVLLHLAWGGLPNYSSLHHFETELPAHYNFLKMLVQSGLQRLVVCGTCFEYGLQSGALDPLADTRPINPYGFAKDTLRRQLQYLSLAHPFELTWARLFYLYGEGQPEYCLWPLLRRAVERGDEVFNMSGGEQLRDYLPVAEVARRLASLATDPIEGGAILNVCAGQPISVRKLVEGWLAENNWSIKLNLGHYPYSENEPLAFWGKPGIRL